MNRNQRLFATVDEVYTDYKLDFKLDSNLDYKYKLD